MRLLFKKLWRDILQTKGQFAAILTVIAVGVAFFAGLNTTLRNLSDISGEYFESYRLADISVLFFRAPESTVKTVAELPFVKMAQGRITRDAKVDISDNDAMVRLVTIPDTRRTIPNDLMIRSGRYFTSGDVSQCIVEEGFFNANRLKIGDSLEPVINGSRVKLTITGTAKTPEYVYMIRDAGEFVPDNRKFGVVYIKESFGQSIFGYENSISEINALLKPGTDRETAKREIARVLKEYDVLQVIKKEDQLSYNTFTNEIKSLEAMGNVFPLIFFAVASLIIYITMSRMMENQRNQMGILMALGYSDSSIFLHYLSYASITGILGSIIGYFPGIYAGKYMLSLYNSMYKLPYSEVRTYPGLLVPAILITLFFCIAAGYNSCKGSLNTIPAQAMRPRAPASGKRTLVEKVKFIWNSLNFSWKLILRNIFRYKKRSLLTCLGILSSYSLLLAGIGMFDSIAYVIRIQYPDSLTYDIKVNFNGFVNTKELETLQSLPHVRTAEYLAELGVEMKTDWKRKNIGFSLIGRDADIYCLTDDKGNPVQVPGRGILLPEKLAKSMDINIGDRVTIRPLIPGKDSIRKETVVTGTIPQFMGLSASGDIRKLGWFLDEGMMMNGAVLRLEDPVYEKEVTERLKEMPFVNTILSKKVSRENLVKGMENISSMVYFIIISAGVLAFAVVYNTTTINIFERRREIATLKVLGFNPGEMKQIVFNENLIITFFAIFAGIPAGRWLQSFILLVSSTENLTFPTVINLPSYFLAAAATFGFTLLTNQLLSRKLSDVDMVESLKSAE